MPMQEWGPWIPFILSVLGALIGILLAVKEVPYARERLPVDKKSIPFSFVLMPATVVAYGLLLYIQLKHVVSQGQLDSEGVARIGWLAGLIFAIVGITLGFLSKKGIWTLVDKPENLGKVWTGMGMIQSIALLAFILAIILL